MALITERFATNADLNRALCEAAAKGDRVRFSESMFAVDLTSVRRVPADEAGKSSRLSGSVREAAGQGDGQLWEAKVGHFGRKNQNERLYPRAVWQDQLDHYLGKGEGSDKTRLEAGFLAGAVDHLGWYQGGNLQDTCILFRELWMEGGGVAGPVMARFEVIEKHSRGADLRAQLDAGMAVGFSTSGYGSGHQPGDAERKEYGLGEDEWCAIMDRNYVLKKIDAVDDPAVADARVSSPEGTGPCGRRSAVEIETLAELKVKFPALVREAVDEATAPLHARIRDLSDDKRKVEGRLAAVTAALDPALEALCGFDEFNFPEREVPRSREQIDNAERECRDLAAACERADRGRREAEAEVRRIEAAVARRREVADIVAAANACLREADPAVRALVVGDLRERVRSDVAFGASGVEAYCAKRAERYRAMVAGGGRDGD